MLICIIVMMTSCVQGDYYDFYEDDDLTLFVGRRKNKSEFSGVDYTIGPSVNEIISDNRVRQKMNIAWNSMLQSCNENGRKEYGFRIYYKRNNGDCIYSFSDLVSGEFLPWHSGAQTTINLSGYNKMNGAVLCAVFHVHTSYHSAPSNSKRKTGLSGEDSASVTLFPTIILDYSDNEIHGGMSESDPIIYSYDPRCD